MNKSKHLTPEEKELISFFFEKTSELITPDFSKQDWLDLHARAHEGDMTSMEMFIALFKDKVIPQLKPEILEAINYKEHN